MTLLQDDPQWREVRLGLIEEDEFKFSDVQTVIFAYETGIVVPGRD